MLDVLFSRIQQKCNGIFLFNRKRTLPDLMLLPGSFCRVVPQLGALKRRVGRQQGIGNAEQAALF